MIPNMYVCVQSECPSEEVYKNLYLYGGDLSSDMAYLEWLR